MEPLSLFREPWILGESILHVLVNSGAFRTLRTLLHPNPKQVAAEAPVSGAHLRQVEGDEALFPTDPLGNIRDDATGIATLRG